MYHCHKLELHDFSCILLNISLGTMGHHLVLEVNDSHKGPESFFILFFRVKISHVVRLTYARYRDLPTGVPGIYD